MAANDAAEGFERAAQGAVFVDRVDGVLTARWAKPALAAEELSQRGAVEQNEMYQQPSHHEMVGGILDQWLCVLAIRSLRIF